MIYSSLQLPDQLAELGIRAEQVHLSPYLADQDERGLHLLLPDQQRSQMLGYSDKIEAVFGSCPLRQDVLERKSVGMRQIVEGIAD